MITLHSYIFPLASLSRTSTAAGSAGVSTTSSSTVYTARAFVSHHRPSVHDRPSSTPSSHPSRVRDPSTARSNSHPTHPARQTYSDRARAIHPSVHSSVRLSLSRIIHPSRARESTPRTSSTVSSGASARSASSLDIVVVVVCGRSERDRDRASVVPAVVCIYHQSSRDHPSYTNISQHDVSIKSGCVSCVR